MTTLARAIVALAPTKRRRLLWCAWWTGTPTIEAFRPPDAWGGGATTAAEAVAMAERAAARRAPRRASPPPRHARSTRTPCSACAPAIRCPP